jgi:hypothetical protein
MIRLKKFSDTKIGPVYKNNRGWCYDVFHPLGEPNVVGGFSTRKAARQSQREAKNNAPTGAYWEWRWRKL